MRPRVSMKICQGRRDRPDQGYPQRSANAASVATLLLTSDALVAEKPKKEEKGPAGHGGGHDMY